MATLTGKAVSELPAATAANDADLFAISQSGASKKITKSALLGGYVKKAGDTMTGNLTVEKTSEIDIFGKRTDVAVGSTGSARRWAGVFGGSDQNGVNIGYIGTAVSPTGQSEVIINSRNTANGSTYNNQVIIGVNADGTKYVYISDSAAWISALGLTTSTTGTVTKSSRISGGSTDGMQVVKVGNVVNLSARVYGIDEVASGAFFVIPDGYRPRGTRYVMGGIVLQDSTTPIPVRLVIDTSGNVLVSYSSTLRCTQVLVAGCYVI